MLLFITCLAAVGSGAMWTGLCLEKRIAFWELGGNLAGGIEEEWGWLLLDPFSLPQGQHLCSILMWKNVFACLLFRLQLLSRGFL